MTAFYFDGRPRTDSHRRRVNTIMYVNVRAYVYRNLRVLDCNVTPRVVRRRVLRNDDDDDNTF